VTLPIAQRARRVRAEETKDGLEAISDVVVTRTAGERALVEVRTRYGRRHQVRAHLASIPLPIVGDDLYGSASDDGRLALHASSLRLPDGRTFEAPLPPDFVAMLARAGLGS
jgi:23S rRNA-/tRNA-specific pseudouridylate synthase